MLVSLLLLLSLLLLIIIIIIVIIIVIINYYCYYYLKKLKNQKVILLQLHKSIRIHISLLLLPFRRKKLFFGRFLIWRFVWWCLVCDIFDTCLLFVFFFSLSLPKKILSWHLWHFRRTPYHLAGLHLKAASYNTKPRMGYVLQCCPTPWKQRILLRRYLTRKQGGHIVSLMS